MSGPPEEFQTYPFPGLPRAKPIPDDEKCPACKGEAVTRDGPRKLICEACGGTGRKTIS